MNDYEIFAGCQNGDLFQFDLRKIQTPVATVEIGNAAINHIAKFTSYVSLARGMYALLSLTLASTSTLTFIIEYGFLSHIF